MLKQKIVVLIMLAGFVLGSKLALTQPLPVPSSANWVSDTLNLVFNLWNPTESQNWPIYAALGTVQALRYFNGALDASRAARRALLADLERINTSVAEKQRLMTEINEHQIELERAVALAMPARTALGEHIRNASRSTGPDPRTFAGLEDYHALESWLRGPGGQSFLSTQAGQEWSVEFHRLVRTLTNDIEDPLRRIIQRASAVYSERIDAIESAARVAGSAPGDFETRDTTTHARRAIPLEGILPTVENLRRQCLDLLESHTRTQSTLATDSRMRTFWTSQTNILRPVIFGALTGASAVATWWIHRATDFRSRQAQAAAQANQTAAATQDISGTLATPEGRKMMEPYYSAIRDSMREHKTEIVKMLDNNLTQDEKKGLNITRLVEESIDSAKFLVAVEQATISVARDKQGARVTRDQIIEMMRNARTRPDVREGLFRPFTKDVYRGLVNNLWSEISVTPASDHFDISVLRPLMRRTEALLMNGVQEPPAPPRPVPPGPGVVPPPAPTPTGAAGVRHATELPKFASVEKQTSPTLSEVRPSVAEPPPRAEFPDPLPPRSRNDQLPFV